MTKTSLPRIASAMTRTPWAIHPDKLETIEALMVRRCAGEPIDRAEVHALMGAARATDKQVNGAIAILPIQGTIVHRAGMMSAWSGGTSVQAIRADFQQVINDPAIGAVVFDVDSPGGNVDGLPELADEIFSARGTKPIVAVANTIAASGALWLATAADEFSITPSGQAGSVGVIAMHTDFSRADEAAGIKTTFITSSPFKAEGNEFEPLSDAAITAIQARVNHFHEMFTDALAHHRDVSPAAVDRDFGQGRMLVPAEAVEAGMADRIETLAEAVERLGGPAAPARSGARAGTVELDFADIESPDTLEGRALTMSIMSMVSKARSEAERAQAESERDAAKAKAQADEDEQRRLRLRAYR